MDLEVQESPEDGIGRVNTRGAPLAKVGPPLVLLPGKRFGVLSV